MRMWLAAVTAVPLVTSVPAHAQANAVQATVRRHANASDFTLPSIPQFVSQSPLQDGMIATEDVAPNAHVGLGLAPMLGRNIHSVRIEHEPVPTRNPGVTLVFGF
ncbi:MAG TPA: hypothetical protein VNR86_10340 [Sphingomicrobium sp.]|nr:hypothetical protein [Sphingomicrobium sp.]